MSSATIPTRQAVLPTPPLPGDLPEVDLTENARQVLVRRYVRRGDDGRPAESVEEMFWRVAYHVARVEEAWSGDVTARARQYYHLLTSKSFFPNSPTFTGAGTPLGQLAACFVLPIADDMGRKSAGIFQTLRDAALIQQTGGGNGFSFSRLRPRGSLVKSSAGEATGPVGFLRVYDHAFGEVAQGGSRRGANMAVLRVDHPDVEDFITCKTDENSITNFNISVGITDAFMRCVEKDEEWELVFPDVHAPEYRSFDGTTEQAIASGVPMKVYRTVKARDLFAKIVHQAHHNGEPGMLFLDAANRSNPVPHLYQLEATNPCFIGSTRIATDRGLLTIAEMAAGEFETLVGVDGRALGIAGLSFHPASPAWKTRLDTPVLRLVTEEGYTVTATPDHKFLTPTRGYIPLESLIPGDTLLIQSDEGAWSRQYDLPNTVAVAEAMAVMGRGGDRASGKLTTRTDFASQYANLPTRWSHDLGFVMGTLVGDGWLSPTSNAPLGMVFANAKTEALDMVHNAMRSWFGEGHLHQRESLSQLTYGRLPYQFFASLGVLPAPAHQKQVPVSLWQAPREAVIGFLQGLFTADGTVNLTESKRSCSIRLASASTQLLAEVQLLLLNLGIAGKIHLRRPAGERSMPDGKGGRRPYAAHADYELIIDKTNRDLFLEKVGFIDPAKQNKAQGFVSSKVRRSNREDFLATVARVEDAGLADVYDLTEPHSHSLIANGFVAHNCGEQWLGPYENCCLGSVNLATCLGADGKVNWEKLRQDVVLSTRFLDDVVDANMYVPAVPSLSEAAHRARRIGLGVMGLADIMFHCGIRYGSNAGMEFAAQLLEFVRYHAMQTSIELSAERGPFPAITGSIYDPAALKWAPPAPLLPYTRDFERPALDWSAITSGIRAHGIRNAAQATIAPTGTIATVAGCEGYGCEPAFALAYTRHVNDKGKDLVLTYASPQFERALERAGVEPDDRQDIIEQVMEHGSCQGVPAVPDGVREVFAVSGDITADEHVRMQAAMQAFVDNSLSKTINFPPNATEEDVATAYLLAWKLGCKGITVYVTGSREKVVLETKATADKKQPALRAAAEPVKAPALRAPEEQPEPTEQLLIWHDLKKPRPHYLAGFTYSIETPLGKAFVTINENGGSQPFEMFVNTAKAGSETAAVSEALGRLVSYILRLASPVEPSTRLQEAYRQLAGIGGGRSLGFGPHRVRSLPDGLAQILEDYLRHREERLLELKDRPALQPLPEGDNGSAPLSMAAQPEQPLLKIGDLCPECGQAAVVNEEGCRKCYACGYSEC